MVAEAPVIHRSIALEVRTPDAPAVEDNCKLVPIDGFQHIGLAALGFIELQRELGFVLMQAPPGFEVVGR